MKVKHAALVSLLKELNMPTAGNWPEDRLQKKLTKLPALVEQEELEAKSADGKALLKKLLAAVEAEEDITISGAPQAAAEEAAPPAKEEKKSSKKAPAAEEDEDEDEEEAADEDEDEDESEDEDEDEGASDEDESEDGDDEDEDEEEKPSKKKAKSKDKEGKKKGAPKKAGEPGKPGVIASIQEVIERATAKKPATKDAILDVLKTRFPDRDPESMMRTINVQIPNRMKKDKGINIVKAEKGGYYVAEGKA